jgi:hypothetical protein
MSKGGFGRGRWCFVGDFNAVLHREERRGVNGIASSSQLNEIVEFQAFVDVLEVVDLPVLGRNFTWFHSSGSSMSRIDRALVSSEWISCWGNPSLWILPRTISDHCPLVLKHDNIDWGPRPFRFNNHWLKHLDFNRVVEEFWRIQTRPGWMGFVLKEKLKGLKLKIKEWSRNVYGAIDSKILILVGLSEVDLVLRKQKFTTLWHLLKSKDSVLVQRSRVRWLKEGDENTSFFHNCVKSRRIRNGIRALHVDGQWIETPLLVRQATVSFFQSHFQSSWWPRPILEGIVFPSLSLSSNEALILPFSLEEVEGVVMECHGSKSPGPDGFNFNFIKTYWSLLKVEVRILFEQFYVNARLPKRFSSYFVALIPVVNSTIKSHQ